MVKKICPFCDNNVANKTNTHYLTDYIIRTCLNYDGTRQREKGLYVYSENTDGFLRPSFQRGVPFCKLEQAYGRQTTEEENYHATQLRPFSVDYVFCSDCERAFSKIEESFSKEVDYMRRHPFEQNGEVSHVISDFVCARRFFYLQLWRAHICDPCFWLSKSMADRLREMLRNEPVNPKEVTSYPLEVSYLETKMSCQEKERLLLKGYTDAEIQALEQRRYTSNMIFCLSRENHVLIMMNDFAISIYEEMDGVPDNHRSYVNYNEDRFTINVFYDADRLSFLKKVHHDRFAAFRSSCKDVFLKLCQINGIHPDERDYNEIMRSLIGAELSMCKYTEQSFEKYFKDFFNLNKS